MSKYILNPDGTISKLPGSDSAANTRKQLDEDKIGGEKLFNNFDNSKYQSVTEYLSANENNVGISFLGSSAGFKSTNPDKVELETSFNDLLATNNISTTKVKNKKLLNDSHDFLTGEDKTTTYLQGKHVETILNFNSIGGDNKIFASEIEMAGGIPIRGSTNIIETAKKATIVFEILINAIVHIAAAEAIFYTSSLLDANKINDVEENFHLNLGENGILDTNAFDSFLFKRLNYPKTKTVNDVTEKISAFIVGFLELISGDNLFDFKKISNLNSDNRFRRLMHKNYGTSFDITSNNSFFQISNIIGATLFYLTDSLATLTSSSINRLMLIERKISHQNYWIDKLYDAKKSDFKPSGFLDSSLYIDNFMKSMDYYFFKFVIERMHIGLKLISYYEYNKTNDSHATFESPSNRVGLSKSGYKTYSYILGKKEDHYAWTLKLTGSHLSQATRVRSLPQGFLMSREMISLLNSPTLQPHENTFTQELLNNFSIAADEKSRSAKGRIHRDLVMKIEKYLNAEYMPFYFHDLRTNEIVSFHAFIDNISDSFSPEYTTHSGFGRVDDIKNYIKTTRNISLSFTIAATSKNDHDLMWYQINKLVSMVYPQWSRGVKNNVIPSMQYPFTQIPTNSPLIRLRVGDVIKSNYSKKNLARKFGMDKLYLNNDDMSSLLETHSAISNSNPRKNAIGQGMKDYSNLSRSAEKDIYFGKFHYSASDNNLDLYSAEFDSTTQGAVGSELDETKSLVSRVDNFYDIFYLIPGLYLTEVNPQYLNPNPLINAPIFSKLGSRNLKKEFIHIKKYTPVSFVQPDGERTDSPSAASYDGAKKLRVWTYPFVLICDSNSIIKKSRFAPGKFDDFERARYESTEDSDGMLDFVTNEDGSAKIKYSSSKRFETDKNFLINNPILDAYESAAGEGLAGFITNLDINYNEQLWETSEEYSKAPHAVKITISYSPIHDIPLGLDKEGMMTAPAYNVGGLNREIFSSVRDNANLLYNMYLDKMEESDDELGDDLEKSRRDILETWKHPKNPGIIPVSDDTTDTLNAAHQSLQGTLTGLDMAEKRAVMDEPHEMTPYPAHLDKSRASESDRDLINKLKQIDSHMRQDIANSRKYDNSDPLNFDGTSVIPEQAPRDPRDDPGSTAADRINKPQKFGNATFGRMTPMTLGKYEHD